MIHSKASSGFSVGAQAYASGRPGYAPASVDWLKRSLGAGPEKLILELGAGTGKFLPSLICTGARVIAVDPVPEMLAYLRSAFPDIEARIGSAAAIPQPDATLDGIVCAQSFHWFASADALREIRRVLKPFGRFGFIWNVRDDRTPWVREISRIILAHAGDTPTYEPENWRHLFPADGFSPLVEERFEYLHRGPIERVVIERVLSVSYIAALPESERARVMKQVRDLIAATPELRAGGEISFPYVTAAYSCVNVGHHEL